MLTKEQVQKAINISGSAYIPKRLDYKALKEAALTLLNLYYCVPVEGDEAVGKFWGHMAPCHSKKKMAVACRLMRSTCRACVRRECERKNKRKECKRDEERIDEVVRDESTEGCVSGDAVQS